MGQGYLARGESMTVKKCDRTAMTVEVCGGYCEVEDCKLECHRRIKNEQHIIREETWRRLGLRADEVEVLLRCGR